MHRILLQTISFKLKNSQFKSILKVLVSNHKILWTSWLMSSSTVKKFDFFSNDFTLLFSKHIQLLFAYVTHLTRDQQEVYPLDKILIFSSAVSFDTYHLRNIHKFSCLNFFSMCLLSLHNTLHFFFWGLTKTGFYDNTTTKEQIKMQQQQLTIKKCI